MLEFVEIHTTSAITNGAGIDGTLTFGLTIDALADVEKGDLVIAFIAVYDHVAEANTLSLPDEWALVGPSVTHGLARVFAAFKWITDDEPAGYDFEYSAARGVVVTVVAYRGALRDFDFDVVNYPWGFFVSTSQGQTVDGSGTVLTQVAAGLPSTGVRNTMIISHFMQAEAASTPELDDVVPFEAMRSTIRVAKAAAMLVETTFPSVTASVPALTVRSSLSDPWIVTSIAIEPDDPNDLTFDSYKAKVLRSMVPSPPFDTRLKSNLGKLLTVIGNSDNDIGGRFGDDDFLPDEELE